MAKAYKNFRELEAKMSPERRARVAEDVKRMVAEMPLDQLRAARQLTQENLANILGVNQAAVSRLERRADMYVSTLAKFIEAMGGRLEIRAVFPEGAVTVTQLGDDPKAKTAR